MIFTALWNLMRFFFDLFWLKHSPNTTLTYYLLDLNSFWAFGCGCLMLGNSFRVLLTFSFKVRISWRRSAQSPLCLKACTVKHSPGGGWGVWKLWFLKRFSSCRFPQLIPSRRLLFLCPQSRKVRKSKKYKWKPHTLKSGGGERVLAFQRVDWRGFGPLNRSTCSSGISRK